MFEFQTRERWTHRYTCFGNSVTKEPHIFLPCHDWYTSHIHAHTWLTAPRLGDCDLFTREPWIEYILLSKMFFLPFRNFLILSLLLEKLLVLNTCIHCIHTGCKSWSALLSWKYSYFKCYHELWISGVSDETILKRGSKEFVRLSWAAMTPERLVNAALDIYLQHMNFNTNVLMWLRLRTITFFSICSAVNLDNIVPSAHILISVQWPHYIKTAKCK